MLNRNDLIETIESLIRISARNRGSNFISHDAAEVAVDFMINQFQMELKRVKRQMDSELGEITNFMEEFGGTPPD